ncbi:hypothetical protein QAD02_022811, partial [Eretmocerus hayati]
FLEGFKKVLTGSKARILIEIPNFSTYSKNNFGWYLTSSSIENRKVMENLNKKDDTNEVVTVDQRLRGFNVEIGVTRFFMRIHGIWPGMSASNLTITRSSSLLVLLMILVFINVPQTITACQVHRDFSQLMNILCFGDVTIAIASIKLLSVGYHQRVLRKLVNLIYHNWMGTTKESELDIMKKYAERSRLFSIACVSLCEGTVISYTLRAIIISQSGRNVNTMYFPGFFPYDTLSSPNYEVTWTLQMIATFFAAGTFASVDSFIITSMFHLCGQLKNLQNILREIGSDEIQQHSFTRLLSDIVEKHHRIIRCTELMESSFNQMFLGQVVILMILLCLQGYFIVDVFSEARNLSVDMLFMIVSTICCTFSIFVYCYLAEKLREESAGLRTALSMSGWYNLSVQQRKLFLFLVSTNKPLELTAGKFCTLSLQLFCS